jgi:hypothetical protein
MNRLQFLQKAFLLLIGIQSIGKNKLSSASKTFVPKKEILRSHIRGLKYYDGKKVLPSLKVGDSLDLVREPQNPYDPQAIAIYWQGHQLGYIAMELNEGVAMILDYELKELVVNISHIDTQAPLWECIEFTICM